MQLNVTGHHVEVTPSLRSYVEKKLERIGRHFDRLIDVHCVLTVEKLRQKAEATLHVSGSDHAALERAVRDATKDGSTRAEPIETGLEDVFIYLMSRATDNFKVAS